MNLANLENAREQLRLAGKDAHDSIAIAIAYVDEAIRQVEASLPVVPKVEVWQVWVNNNDTDCTMEILGIGKRVALCRDNWGDDVTICLSTITKHYTLQTPAPEVVALTADDVSEVEISDELARSIRLQWGGSPKKLNSVKRRSRIAINTYLAEVKRG